MKTIFKSIYILFFGVLFFSSQLKAQTLQGSINISPDDFAKMKNEWQIGTAPIGGKKIVVELWQVKYQSETAGTNATDIFLLQKKPVSVSYKRTANSINYTILNAAPSNDLAVVVYTVTPVFEPSMRIKGRPFDGQHAGSRFYRYKSDAEKHLMHFGTSNIIYGMYSLAGQPDVAHLDFSFGAQTNKPGCKTCFGFDDIGGVIDKILGNTVSGAGKGAQKILHGVMHTFDKAFKNINGEVISDLADCVAKDFNGIVDAAGFFVNESGQYFYETGGGLVNLVMHGDLPRVRDMTADEMAWADKWIYHGAIGSFDKIKIFNFTRLDNQSHRFFTWPGIGAYIYMNLGEEAFSSPMNYIDKLSNGGSSYKIPGQVFIHELGHVWQIRHYGRQQMITRYFNGGEDYHINCGKNENSSFPIEAEATMIDRTFALMMNASYSDTNMCPAFQQKWVEKNVLGGKTYEYYRADLLMRYKADDFKTFFGDVSKATPVHTTGSKAGGEGFFMLGSIPWSVVYYSIKDQKAYANWGEIRKKYNSLNSEHGILGWPQTDIGNLRDGGSFQRFEGGFIHSSTHGTFYMSITPIINTYGSNNWEKGPLGYPISDFIPDPNIHAASVVSGEQRFEHGVITYSSISGANLILNGTVVKNKEHLPIVNDKAKTQINPQPLPPRKKN